MKYKLKEIAKHPNTDKAMKAWIIDKIERSDRRQLRRYYASVHRLHRGYGK